MAETALRNKFCGFENVNNRAFNLLIIFFFYFRLREKNYVKSGPDFFQIQADNLCCFSFYGIADYRGFADLLGDNRRNARNRQIIGHKTGGEKFAADKLALPKNFVKIPLKPQATCFG